MYATIIFNFYTDLILVHLNINHSNELPDLFSVLSAYSVFALYRTSMFPVVLY